MTNVNESSPATAPLSLSDIKAAVKARHASAVSELAQAVAEKAQVGKRIAALRVEEAASARILRSVEGRKTKK